MDGFRELPLQFMDRFVPRDDGGRGWIDSCLATTGRGWIASFLAMTGKGRDDCSASLRAERGNPWIASFLAMTGKRAR